MARAVFLLAAPDFSFDFVSGRHRVDLSEARLGTTDAISFERQVGRSPERLIEAIGLLARTLPSTLVLVVDQAEEMFTLEPGETGLQARDAFFDFLTLLGETPTDLRLIVSLRTEYFGHFAHQVYHRDLDAESLREYLLLDLDAKGLQQAILRPTESISIGPFGAADRYRFAFEAKLVDQLVVDLRRAAPQGGVLPVLQIVCGRLYQKTRLSGEPPPSWVIGLRDYEGFGRVIDLIDGYFTDTLRTLFARLLSGREPETIEAELYRWRRLLLALVRRQPDGTVTSELKPALELDGEARKVGCLLPFGPTAEDLAQEQRRILRRNEVLHQDGRIVLCYSLGHDILGQAMLKWQDEDKNVKWQMNAVASLTVASAKSNTATSDYELMNIVDTVRNVAATKSEGDAGWHNQILWVTIIQITIFTSEEVLNPLEYILLLPNQRTKLFPFLRRRNLQQSYPIWVDVRDLGKVTYSWILFVLLEFRFPCFFTLLQILLNTNRKQLNMVAMGTPIIPKSYSEM